MDRPERQVRTRPLPTCALCGNPGEFLFTGMSDRLFAAPDRWDLKRCPNHGCGLVWLDPMPIEDDIGKLYETYYTHAGPTAKAGADPTKSLRALVRRGVMAAAYGYPHAARGRLERWLGRVLATFGPFREIAGCGVMWLDGARRGRLLDVGCGSGKFLCDMRQLGWEVAGVDPDPKIAGHLRQEHGLDVRQGSLESARLPEGSFDVVTMNNVIEHLPDPIATLREVYRVLRAGGRLVVLTPNIDSTASRAFLSAWVHWDPPRHLFLFSQKTLPALAQRAGFRVATSTTSARRAWWTWAVSRLIRETGHVPGGNVGVRLWLRAKSMAIHWRQHRACRTKPAGEELLLIGVKPGG